MTELICVNGHVIDPGKEICSRCNRGPEESFPTVEPTTEAEIPEESEPEKTPEPPPVDNDHVAPGASKFKETKTKVPTPPKRK